MKLRVIGTNQQVLEFKDGTRILFSYESPVAAFVPNEGYEKTERFISRTSEKHAAKWIGKETCKTVSQEQLAQRLNDRVGIHGAEAGDTAL
ncbi:hypothetical protein ACQUFY_05775 [Robbsia andropogonis]|uniref:hypothetical protein n=1 Tax=Robbsia andropogonis TaxID=28092 RepID=UPI003D1EBFA3